jgi:hypothetical protein
VRQSTGNLRFMTSAFPRFEFHFVMRSDWEKKLLPERIFMFGPNLWFMFGHGCFYCIYTVGFWGQRKSWRILQSVLILISDLGVWIRIRRRLTGLKGSRRSNSTLENRTASTEHFSSQISVNFATLRKNSFRRIRALAYFKLRNRPAASSNELKTTLNHCPTVYFDLKNVSIRAFGFQKSPK